MTQLVAATHAFAVRGELNEGRQRCEHVLRLDVPALGVIAVHSGQFEPAVEHLERYAAFAETSPRVIERVACRWGLAGALSATNRDPAGLVQRIIDDATAAGWPTGMALGHQAAAMVIATSDPRHSLSRSLAPSTWRHRSGTGTSRQ